MSSRLSQNVKIRKNSLTLSQMSINLLAIGRLWQQRWQELNQATA
jgi:hypothetical protein